MTPLTIAVSIAIGLALLIITAVVAFETIINHIVADPHEDERHEQLPDDWS